MTFRLGEIPQGWEQIQISEAKLAFRNDAQQATALVNARCDQDGEDAPLSALTQHLFLLFTEREIVEQSLVPLDGREAMHTVLNAKLDGVPKAFDVYVLKKDGCVYDFVLISSLETFDGAAPGFRGFVSGFRTVSD